MRFQGKLDRLPRAGSYPLVCAAPYSCRTGDGRALSACATGQASWLSNQAHESRSNTRVETILHGPRYITLREDGHSLGDSGLKKTSHCHEICVNLFLQHNWYPSF